MISERSLAVLHAIVSDFVTQGEPIGSKTIVEKYNLGVSAATVRNDMAFLEEEDLIVAPHTSSGRIPTDKGYRLYVDTLTKIRPLTSSQRNAIERFLGESSSLDDMMGRTARILANLTNQVAVIQHPQAREEVIRHLELIPVSADSVLSVLITNTAKVDQQIIRLGFDVVTDSLLNTLKEKSISLVVGKSTVEAQKDLSEQIYNLSEWESPDSSTAAKKILNAIIAQLEPDEITKVTVSGAANLTKKHDNQMNLPSVLEALEEQVTLLRLIQELVTDQKGVGISIGRENLHYGLKNASLLASNYDSGNQLAGKLSILGPTRMDYAKNIAAMRAVSRYIQKLLGDNPLA